MDICITFILTLLCIYSSFKEVDSKYSDSLKLVHIVFRHGDRTPINVHLPNNPHSKEKYYPYGHGQLTNSGKRRAYNLGKWLRQRYDKFLNDTFSVKEISAISTSTGRSKASLSLVLAGMYPPKGTLLEWNENLNWNPINFQVLPAGHPLLMLLHPICTNFLRLFESFTKTKAGENILQKYDGIRDHMTNYTNLVFNSTATYYAVYDLFLVQQEFGLDVPKWIEQFMPLLANSSMDFIRTAVGTKELKQIVVGHLIKKIIDDTTLKLSNVTKLRNRKMHIYSAHDINVGSVLELINPSYKHERPPYSACLMFEVHTIGDVQGMKVFYQPDTRNRALSISIDNCGKFCPLQKFLLLFKDYFPVNNDC